MTTPLAKQIPEKIQLEVLMKPKDFDAAGLKKLSPEELQNLNHWLTKFLEDLGQGPKPNPPDPIPDPHQ